MPTIPESYATICEATAEVLLPWVHDETGEIPFPEEAIESSCQKYPYAVCPDQVMAAAAEIPGTGGTRRICAETREKSMIWVNKKKSAPLGLFYFHSLFSILQIV